MRRVLITGAGSYVGGRVRERLEHEPGRFEVAELDVRDPSWRRFDLSGWDCVYHVAGIAHVSADPAMEPLYMSVNRDLAIEVGRRAKAAGVGQLIFMSSAIVYGDAVPPGEASPITGETPVNPSNYYGLSKVEAEIGLMELADASFRVAVLRCPMIYGPGCKGNFPRLARLARAVPAFPETGNRRSFLYVGNLAELVADIVASGRGGLFLPQDGEPVSTFDLVREAARAQGRDVSIARLASPAARLATRLPGAVGDLSAKVLGSLYYDPAASECGIDYRVFPFVEAVRASVSGERQPRALVVASVASMIDQFNRSNIELLQSMGYEVDVATNFESPGTISAERSSGLKGELEALGVAAYQVGFPREPTLAPILSSYRETRGLLSERCYDLIHCQSPVAGAICRIAASRHRRHGTRVIYTAHGFHFYTGAPLKNWLLYYPVEWALSWLTDALITINHEDYDRARRHLHARRTEYVPGVGVDLERFSGSGDGARIREELGIGDKFMLLSVGELNENKNHSVIIRALSKLDRSDIHYVIAGKGGLKEKLIQLATDLNVAERVHLVGFRSDIPSLYEAADICVFPSIREGLGLAAIEGMAAGLPVIASINRGTRDYLTKDNSIMCSYDDVDTFAEAIMSLCSNDSLRKSMGKKAKADSCRFDIGNTVEEMEQIYIISTHDKCTQNEKC